jgi:hypothetical protein
MALWVQGALRGVSRTKRGTGRFSPTAAVGGRMAVVEKDEEKWRQRLEVVEAGTHA